LGDRADTRKGLDRQKSLAEIELKKADDELAGLQKRLAKLEGTLVIPKLLDSASVPTVPSGPERSWWTVLVFVTAVLGATFAGLGAPLLSATYGSACEVAKHLRLPVLGEVSVVSESDRRKRWAKQRLLQWVAVGLLAAGVVLVVVLFAQEAQIYGLRLFLFGS